MASEAGAESYYLVFGGYRVIEDISNSKKEVCIIIFR